jgi:hypothetical protein
MRSGFPSEPFLVAPHMEHAGGYRKGDVAWLIDHIKISKGDVATVTSYGHVHYLVICSSDAASRAWSES